ETVGLLIELYPLRTMVSEGETFSSLGSKVAGATMDMLRHVIPGASASPGARAFGIVLNYITANLSDFAGLPAHANWIHSGFGDRDHGVRVQVHDFNLAGDPVVDFDLDEATFGGAEREWAVRHFVALFEAAAHDRNQEIDAVPLTSAEEEATFAPPGAALPIGASSVVALFLARAGEIPEAVAIQDEGRSITYGALASRARALAVQLRLAGVGPEKVVGVCLDRS